jgi:hypothetical protein
VRPPSDRVAEHPRFMCRLDLNERQISLLTYELDRAADLNRHHSAHEILRRMARSIQETGAIDIDVSDFGLDDRRAMLVASSRLKDNLPSDAYSAGYSVHLAWTQFVDDSSEPRPVPPPQPTIGQRVIALGLEKEIEQ